MSQTAPYMTTPGFPDHVSGRDRVAYLVAFALGEQAHRRDDLLIQTCRDVGSRTGLIELHGTFDLRAVVDALIAAAPPLTPT